MNEKNLDNFNINYSNIKKIKDITKDFNKEIKYFDIKYFPEIRNIDKIEDISN